jgi:hypothetical protein
MPIEPDLYELLSKDPAYGPDFANKLKAANAAPKYAQRIFVVNDATDADGALQNVGGFIKGTQSGTVLPGAFRVIYLAVGNRLGLVPLSQAPESGKRPKEDGLTESAVALCDAKEAPESKTKMVVTDFDPVELRDNASQIDLTRELTRPATAFVSALTRTLVVEENAVYDMVSTQYGRIRQIAQSDEVLSDKLSPCEDYLYGSAKQGAQTNKEHAKLKNTIQTEADKKALLNAGVAVRQGVSAQIRSLADELTASDPLPNPLPTGGAPAADPAAAAPSDPHKGRTRTR